MNGKQTMNATAQRTEPAGAQATEPTLDSLFHKLASSPAGLTVAMAKTRLAQCRPSALEQNKNSGRPQFPGDFWGPVPRMIEAAAMLAAIVSHRANLMISSALPLFNTVVGFWQAQPAAVTNKL